MWLNRSADNGDYMSQVMGDPSDRALHLFAATSMCAIRCVCWPTLRTAQREFGWRNNAVTKVLAQARVEFDVRTTMLEQVEAAISLDLPVH